MVIIISAVAFYKKQKSIHAFDYSLGNKVVLKVIALLTMSLLLSLSAVFIILATHDLTFIEVVFEVLSALSNVGLSRG